MKSFYLKSYFAVLLFVIIMSSCASREDVVYFQDEKLGDFSQPTLIYDFTYQPNDMLTIDVSAYDPETVRPFNLTTTPYSENPISARSEMRMQTYIVDAKGYIELPVIGKIKISGLTREQAKDFLEEKIAEYAKEPLVNIRITNFTITVLGEVNNPGAFTIQDEKVTLTEAIGLAGDLTIYGKRNNVLLIREIDGIKKFSIIDLTSIKTLTNNTFNLKQNDIIYVEPNKARIRSSSFNQNNSVIISAVATLATIVAILIR